MVLPTFDENDPDKTVVNLAPLIQVPIEMMTHEEQGETIKWLIQRVNLLSGIVEELMRRENERK